MTTIQDAPGQPVAVVVGSTGLVGSQILKTLCNQTQFSKVFAFTRRNLDNDSKLTEIKSTDTSTWPSSYPKDGSVFFSGLGTTRAEAGGLANQRKIDYDLNLDLAKAARAAGTRVYVLISTHGASAGSVAPYTKMKGQLEDAVKELGFEHCIILRPGLLVGRRTKTRTAEGIAQNAARFMNSINGSLMDFWAVDATVVARAAVAASQRVLDGSEKSGSWIVTHRDVIRLGRTEWTS